LQKDDNHPNNIENRVDKAIYIFDNFYTLNRENASVYFRLLYRIFQLIDTSQIEEKKKAEYAKIMRCQLSEDELFLLRYNAMTINGKKMQLLINKYNLLKHLPIMSLLEFQVFWRHKLAEIERNSIDSLFILLRKQMMESFLSQEKEKKYEYGTAENRYVIKYKINDTNNNSMEIAIIRNDSFYDKKTVENSLNKALDKFGDEELKNLLVSFLKEVFFHSNFSNYANLTDIVINEGINKQTEKEISTIWATIENKNYFLIISKRQLDNPAGITDIN
jgi:hypothetical protein